MQKEKGKKEGGGRGPLSGCPSDRGYSRFAFFLFPFALLRVVIRLRGRLLGLGGGRGECARRQVEPVVDLAGGHVGRWTGGGRLWLRQHVHAPAQHVPPLLEQASGFGELLAHLGL